VVWTHTLMKSQHICRTVMITLIGTGHVFNLSAALLSIFDEKEPEVVAVELDPQRYQAILLRNTDPATYNASKKNLPIIYRVLAQFQESMAEQYGVNAGDEMLTAINYAQSHQLPSPSSTLTHNSSSRRCGARCRFLKNSD